jgi:uncharacterized protein (DUF433 family)
MGIVASEDTLGGDPRLEGRRISVLQIAERVLTHDQSPENVADQLDVTMAEVHEALAYYYEHVEEMNEIRERHRELEADLEEAATPPPERAER